MHHPRSSSVFALALALALALAPGTPPSFAAPSVAEISFDLSATTDSGSATPAFNCTGDGVYKFPYKKSTPAGVGTMQAGSCTLKGPIPMHRAFHLEALDSAGQAQEDIFYNINSWTGAISGNSLLKQTALFFGSEAMSYGVSHAAPPVTDQAYIYLGSSREQWMKNLQTSFPDLLMADLVLPGAHDAGMYTMNIEDLSKAVAEMCKLPVLKQICGAASATIGAQAIANLSLTQKDVAYDQLRLGTRMFDFRPAYASNGVAYHVHNFIPGVQFNEFLGDLSHFLVQANREVAFIQVTHAGVNTDLFTPLTKEQVTEALSNTIDSSVGYTVVESIASLNDQRLADVAKSGTRLIVVCTEDPTTKYCEKEGVNDSYSHESYSQSLTDPSSVIAALEKALGNCSSTDYQYNVFQLQDTGEAALGHYKSEIAAHLTSWANDLLFSGTGSILQATKPAFDRGTYTWLGSASTLEGLEACKAPIVLLNDFVDPALAARGEALTTYRYKN